MENCGASWAPCSQNIINNDNEIGQSIVPERPRYDDQLTLVSQIYDIETPTSLKTPVVSESNRVTGSKARILNDNYYSGSLLHESVKLLLSGVRSTDRTRFNSIWRKCHLHLLVYWEDYIARCKKLTELVKQWQDDFWIGWKLLVDLQLIAAYQLKKSEPDINDAIHWLHTPATHDIDGKSDFITLFGLGIDDFLSRMPTILPEKSLSIKEFIDTPALWATSGSSMRAPKIKDLRSNKWTLAYMMDQSTMVDWMIRQTRNTVHVFVKENHEPIKNRFIATSDDPINLQQSFLDYYISPMLKHCGIIASYLSDKDWINRYRIFMQYKRAKIPSVDIDQTEFDHGVNRDMVLITIEKIINFICRKNVSDVNINEIRKVGEIMIKNMMNLQVTGDNFMFPWQNGIASGWRWTALLDSIINWAEGFVIDCDMASDGYDITRIDRVVQGDDICEFYRNGKTATDRVNYWIRRKFNISKGKTIINKKYSEFLRYAISEDSVSGYPARVLHSILVKDPTQQTSGETISDEYEKLHTVSILSSRERVNIDNFNIRSGLINILHLSSVYGGVGAYPIKTTSIEILPEVYMPKSFKGIAPYKSERMGFKNKQKVRRRKVMYISKVLSFNTRDDNNLMEVTPWHFDLFYEKPDDFYEIMSKRKNQAIDTIETLLFSRLVERSKGLYDIVKTHFTRRLRFMWLAARLPSPSICGLTNARQMKLFSDDMVGRLIHLVVKRNMRIGIGVWKAWCNHICIHLDWYLNYYDMINMTE